MDKVERLIAVIRNSNPNAVELYTQGQCYAFHLILREAFGPRVVPWYQNQEGHVYSKIGHAFYDIRGKHLSVPGAEPLRATRPDRWGKRDRRVLCDPLLCAHRGRRDKPRAAMAGGQ